VGIFGLIMMAKQCGNAHQNSILFVYPTKALRKRNRTRKELFDLGANADGMVEGKVIERSRWSFNY
jgi:cytochrome c-type biogenesis protein CcmE